VKAAWGVADVCLTKRSRQGAGAAAGGSDEAAIVGRGVVVLEEALSRALEVEGRQSQMGLGSDITNLAASEAGR